MYAVIDSLSSGLISIYMYVYMYVYNGFVCIQGWLVFALVSCCMLNAMSLAHLGCVAVMRAVWDYHIARFGVINTSSLCWNKQNYLQIFKFAQILKSMCRPDLKQIVA